MKNEEKNLQPQDELSEENVTRTAPEENGDQVLGGDFEWDVDALIQDIMSGVDDENVQPLPEYEAAVEEGPDPMEKALEEVKAAEQAAAERAAAEEAARQAAEQAAAEEAARQVAEQAAAEEAARQAEQAAAEEAARQAAEQAQQEEAPVVEQVSQSMEPSPEGAGNTPAKPAVPPAKEELAEPEFISPEELMQSKVSDEEKATAIHKVIHQPRRKRMRKRNFLGYFIAEGVRGIFSHGFMSFAASSIITVCLLILGSFSLVTLNLDYNLENVMSKNQFYAYVDENYSEDEARALESAIRQADNVAEVAFITREEAKANFMEDEPNSAQIESLPDSVFRHRFSVTVENLELLDDTITQVSNIEGIADISADRDLADKLVMIRNAFTIVALVLVASLLLVSLFIIYNTIKLATVGRQQEIAIMKMCGATNGFIRWPFIYEGAILGLVGSSVAFGLQYAIYYGIMQVKLTGLGELVRIIAWSDVYLYVLGIFLAVGLIIGMFGSVLAIRKFLKV